MKLKCDQCSKEYYTKEGLKLHFQRIHSGIGEKYECNLCDAAKFTTKGGRDNHIVASHTGERAFKCKECPAKFASKSNLWVHQLVHTEGRTSKCEICYKSYKHRRDLDRHVREIHSRRTKDFGCSNCQKSFFTKSHLNQHSKTHGQDVRQYCCYFCPKAFGRREHQELHLRSHTLEKPFFCPEVSCQYSSSHTGDLSRHRKLHHPPIGGQSTPSRIWSCYFCFKKFSGFSQLVIHVRNHSLETPFICGLCQRSFKTDTALRNHILTHTKEKSFRCPHCQKCFPFKHTLKGHIASIHLRKNRFFCQFCSHSSYRKSDFKKHQLSKHLPSNK